MLCEQKKNNNYIKLFSEIILSPYTTTSSLMVVLYSHLGYLQKYVISTWWLSA